MTCSAPFCCIALRTPAVSVGWRMLLESFIHVSIFGFVARADQIAKHAKAAKSA
jgi:hypothetical protein